MTENHYNSPEITDMMDEAGYYKQCHEFTERVRTMLGAGYGIGYQLDDLWRILEVRCGAYVDNTTLRSRADTYEEILRTVCGHLELPQSESGPADDLRLYDRALEAEDVLYRKTEAERAEHMHARYRAEAACEKLTKALEAALRANRDELSWRNAACDAIAAYRTPAPVSNVMGARIATVEDHNAAFDPADEVLGGAFKAGFKEGWIYAEIDADGDRYQEMAEEYGLAVDTAPQECWDAHREKFFAMLPLAAIPEVGAAIGDVEGEIARVVQSVNEWDDRTSPDDYPDHLLITSEELTLILRNFAVSLSSPMEGEQP